MASTGSTAHLMRAASRYSNRLGNQFAGSITYYSVLCVVPILMFAFSGLGFTLTVVRPQWRGTVRDIIARNFAAGPMQDQLLLLMDSYLYNWRAITVAAIVTALYVGSVWTGQLKGAIRAMWRPEFDIRNKHRYAWAEPIYNFAVLLILLALALVTMVANVMGTRLAHDVVGLFHIEDQAYYANLIRVLALVVSLVAGCLLFLFVYRVLPEEHAPWPAVLLGAVWATVLLWLLQNVATGIGALLNRNMGISFFGPVIVAMLFLNIIAQMMLFVAAWIATSNQPAVARRFNLADLPLLDRSDLVQAEGHWEAAAKDHDRRVADISLDEVEKGPNPDTPVETDPNDRRTPAQRAAAEESVKNSLEGEAEELLT